MPGDHSTDDEVDEDPVDDGDAAPTRPASRPARSRPEPRRTDRSEVPTKWAVDRLDSRERTLSFAASGVAVLFSIFVEFAHIKPQKGQLHPETVMIIGLVGAALLLGATLLGRRAPVGFVALFLGASFAQSILFFAAPFFFLAFWLLYRSYKVQKEINASMREARAAGTGASSARGRAASSTSSNGDRSTKAPGAGERPSKPTTARGKAADRARSKGPTAPTPNKRYTPKQPPPKRPPPPKLSRRERKAEARDAAGG
jgi:hypothetical protein